MSAWMWIPIGLTVVVLFIGLWAFFENRLDWAEYNRRQDLRSQARKDGRAYHYDYYYGMYGSPTEPSVIVASTALFAVVVFFLSGFITATFLRSGTEVNRGSTELVALSNNDEIQGHFFLGSGTIDSVQTYSFMKHTADGGFKMGSIEASRAIIYEDDNHPRIEYITHCTPEGFWPSQCDVSYTYKVYIPQGSIWQGYDVDVRN